MPHIIEVTDHYDARRVRRVVSAGVVFMCDDDGPMREVMGDVLRLGAARVADWARAGVQTDACLRHLSAAGYACEIRFDAAHGRRYALAVYPTGNAAKRRCALAALHGMRGTDPEAAS